MGELLLNFRVLRVKLVEECGLYVVESCFTGGYFRCEVFELVLKLLEIIVEGLIVLLIIFLDFFQLLIKLIEIFTFGF